MTNKEYADSLRLIADWFEQHKEIASPYGGHEFKYFNYDKKEDLARLAKALGSTEKEFSGDLFYLKGKKMFGCIEFQAVGNRGDLCRKVKVGTKTVHVEARGATEAQDVEVPVYEWKCDEPILAAQS